MSRENISKDQYKNPYILRYVIHDLANHFQVALGMGEIEGRAYLECIVQQSSEILQKAGLNKEIRELKTEWGSILADWSSERWRNQDEKRQKFFSFCQKIALEKQTNSKALNILFSAKRDICREKNIEIEIFLQIPELFDFEDAELVSLFGNLLDNAIKACEGCSSGFRHIAVDSRIKAGFWCVRMTNNCVIEKERRRRQGYGLRIVQRIVKNHDGDFIIKRRGEQVEVFFMIPISEKK